MQVSSRTVANTNVDAALRADDSCDALCAISMQCSNQSLLLHLDGAHRTLAERIGGTVSFVDNVPRGTVMTLRIPQQQQQAAVETVTACVVPIAAAPAEFTPSSSSSSAAAASAATDGTGSSCDEHSLSASPLSRMRQNMLYTAAAAADEHLLKSKHILVSA
jgi:hypothetical protein